MQIGQLRLRNFRNYDELTLSPHPGLNLFFGQNGSGKTNLLEAIHYCALGRSHRVAQDREVIRRGEEFALCQVAVERGGLRGEVAVKLTPGEAKKKQVLVDRKRAARLSDLMGRLQCVIFSPEDLSLVREGPSARRRYADMLCSQLSQKYFIALQLYQKAMEERGALLRQSRVERRPLPGDVMDAFENEMARAAAVIIPVRRRIIAQTAAAAAEKYAAISGRPEERFQMRYLCCCPEDADVQETLLKAWRARREEDVLRGATGAGLHREDIDLTLNGRPMKQFASQGQVRTAALSMKLAQLNVFREQAGEAPVLLLDDVMSELDITRRTRLLRELEGIQTFVTCTDESDLDGSPDRRTYQVSLSAEGLGRVAQTGAGSPAPQEALPDEPDFT